MIVKDTSMAEFFSGTTGSESDLFKKHLLTKKQEQKLVADNDRIQSKSEWNYWCFSFSVDIL